MKKLIFFLCLLGQAVLAQTGTELIDYTTTTGDKGSFPITAIRGSQNTGTVTSVSGNGTGGATVTVATGTTTPVVTVALSAIPNTSLSNSSVTVAGKTVALGASTTLAFGDLTGAATLAQLPTAIPNANLANASVTVAGKTVALGASTTLAFGDLTGVATLAQLPTAIPNANLANASVTIEGVTTPLGTAYVAGSATVTATGTESGATKLIRCNAAATDITRTLPPAPTDGYMITYKRLNATAGNTIIVPNAGQTLSEGTQVKLVSAIRAVSFQYNLANTQWQIID